jgi:hypothetical protein
MDQIKKELYNWIHKNPKNKGRKLYNLKAVMPQAIK